ncbi:hypothetical protein CEUSTIGMA_g8847.t1 [Chlamydomonas eustigma]|uniref:Uncharacterized protein n=1 Tax=Chlamydomonas eustigma TaxID=1157962 RepID=A0A250XEB1_9CHLO|nr:hypothetical protein CEUSTIGMA_g8847.t1 [Chlamydomonas eustigma]|eukprot:GAX81417.1 hypothetical protein CEUSTIGMA_g8847.t1 [Chlamydomonas eustigma]
MNRKDPVKPFARQLPAIITGLSEDVKALATSIGMSNSASKDSHSSPTSILNNRPDSVASTPTYRPVRSPLSYNKIHYGSVPRRRESSSSSDSSISPPARGPYSSTIRIITSIQKTNTQVQRSTPQATSQRDRTGQSANRRLRDLALTDSSDSDDYWQASTPTPTLVPNKTLNLNTVVNSTQQGFHQASRQLHRRHVSSDDDWSDEDHVDMYRFPASGPAQYKSRQHAIKSSAVKASEKSHSTLPVSSVNQSIRSAQEDIKHERPLPASVGVGEALKMRYLTANTHLSTPDAAVTLSSPLKTASSSTATSHQLQTNMAEAITVLTQLQAQVTKLLQYKEQRMSGTLSRSVQVPSTSSPFLSNHHDQMLQSDMPSMIPQDRSQPLISTPVHGGTHVDDASQAQGTVTSSALPFMISHLDMKFHPPVSSFLSIDQSVLLEQSLQVAQAFKVLVLDQEEECRALRQQAVLLQQQADHHGEESQQAMQELLQEKERIIEELMDKLEGKEVISVADPEQGGDEGQYDLVMELRHLKMKHQTLLDSLSEERETVKAEMEAVRSVLKTESHRTAMSQHLASALAFDVKRWRKQVEGLTELRGVQVQAAMVRAKAAEAEVEALRAELTQLRFIPIPVAPDAAAATELRFIPIPEAPDAAEDSIEALRKLLREEQAISAGLEEELHRLMEEADRDAAVAAERERELVAVAEAESKAAIAMRHQLEAKSAAQLEALEASLSLSELKLSETKIALAEQSKEAHAMRVSAQALQSKMEGIRDRPTSRERGIMTNVDQSTGMLGGMSSLERVQKHVQELESLLEEERGKCAELRVLLRAAGDESHEKVINGLLQDVTGLRSLLSVASSELEAVKEGGRKREMELLTQCSIAEDDAAGARARSIELEAHVMELSKQVSSLSTSLAATRHSTVSSCTHDHGVAGYSREGDVQLQEAASSGLVGLQLRRQDRHSQARNGSNAMPSGGESMWGGNAAQSVIEGLQSEVHNLTHQLEAALKLLPEGCDSEQQDSEQHQAYITRLMSEVEQAQALEGAATQRAQDLEVERDEMIKSLAQYVQQVENYSAELQIMEERCGELQAELSAAQAEAAKAREKAMGMLPAHTNKARGHPVSVSSSQQGVWLAQPLPSLPLGSMSLGTASLSYELLDLNAEEDEEGTLLTRKMMAVNNPNCAVSMKAIRLGHNDGTQTSKTSAGFSWEEDTSSQEDGEAVLRSLAQPSLQPMVFEGPLSASPSLQPMAFGGPLSASSSRKVLGMTAQHSSSIMGKQEDADSASEISSPEELEYSDDFSIAASAPPSPVITPHNQQGHAAAHVQQAPSCTTSSPTSKHLGDLPPLGGLGMRP